jgi:hypothetical protein
MSTATKIYDTVEAINDRTEMAMSLACAYIKVAKDFSDDLSKKERLEAQECRTCFYIASLRIAGQAFTNWECGICHQKATWPNTHFPKICRACALEYGLCVSCGSDVEMKIRKKKESES